MIQIMHPLPEDLDGGVWLSVLNVDNVTCLRVGCDNLLYYASSQDTPIPSIMHIAGHMRASSTLVCMVGKVFKELMLFF